MSDENTPRSVDRETAEDIATNASANDTIGDIIAKRLSRREVIGGALAVTAIGAVAHQAFFSGPENTTPSFSFTELTAGSDQTHHVAEGYEADVLIRWGDKVLADAPKFDINAQTAEAQAKQYGYNNDFVGFLPLDDSGNRALLCVNHEYTNEELMFPSVGAKQSKDFAAMTPDLVAIEMAAHGGSVIEIQRNNGKWSVVENSKYARRITTETNMRLSGPAAGNPRMRTSTDLEGNDVKGMINNCAGAMTPWGTWLTCEENFNGYFWGKEKIDQHPDAAALKRYGVPGEWYNWAHYHDRFDIHKEPNEANKFGWVVEIDPHDPNSVPVKRTALGRFKHEGSGNIINGKDGRFVVYQGDDQRFDYVYKFVTAQKVNLENPAANRDILDHGTLYVAHFNEDGTGEWLPLVHGNGPLTSENGFNDQGDVVIHARLAADLLKPTKMDRPEDVEANEKNGKVYVMLTNNSKREADDTNAANPREKNKYGHIIEMTPDEGDHTSTKFRWDILVQCGDPEKADVGATFNPATSQNGWFANPDNCVIDKDGRLWIATDGNSEKKTGRTDGIWAMETEGSARGTSKLFYRVPVGAEMCGPEITPDLETFFVAVQHPGEGKRTSPSTLAEPMTRWPDFDDNMPPRPAIVAITRKGDGKIAV